MATTTTGGRGNRDGVTTSDLAAKVAASSLKVCTKCHADLTHARRMKDAYGRYWCEHCGEEDSQEKHSSKLKCSGCGELFRPGDVAMFHGKPVCDNCLTHTHVDTSGRKMPRRAYLLAGAALVAVVGLVIWIM